MAYTLAQAAELLGLNPGTLRQQVRLGRLRAEKVGNVWTVTPREIERYRRDSLGARGRYGKGRPAKPLR